MQVDFDGSSGATKIASSAFHAAAEGSGHGDVCVPQALQHLPAARRQQERCRSQTSAKALSESSRGVRENAGGGESMRVADRVLSVSHGCFLEAMVLVYGFDVVNVHSLAFSV